MASVVLWCSLFTSILSIFLAAASAAGCWRLASRVGRALNRKPPSESTLAKLAADQAEVFSSLESLATTVKRLSSRRGMQDMRARREAEPMSKAELLRSLNMSGLTGAAFAQRQLQLERERST
jgi:predicted secreted protein